MKFKLSGRRGNQWHSKSILSLGHQPLALPVAENINEQEPNLHLRLDLLVQSLQLIHVRLLSRPANAHTLLLVRLGDLYNSGE